MNKLQQDEVRLGNKTLEAAQEEVKQLILGPKLKDNTRPINRNIDLGIFLAIHTFGRDLKKNYHIHLSTTPLWNSLW